MYITPNGKIVCDGRGMTDDEKRRAENELYRQWAQFNVAFYGTKKPANAVTDAGENRE